MAIIDSVSKTGLLSLLFVGLQQLPVFADLSESLLKPWDFSPPDNGQPAQREGAATRAPCLPKKHQLTALVPQSGKGLTAQAYPTFFWYLPETTAEKLKFTIRDQEKVTIYSIEYILPPTNKTRIMSLSLPIFADSQSLKIGQEYNWRLQLFCQQDNDTPVTSAEGYVERVLTEADLSIKLENASLTNQLIVLAEAGLWYETLLTLVKLRSSFPNNSEYDSAWLNLLYSVNLKEISQDSLNAEINLN
jgi:Domain of Unknown Function (DUF928)